MSSVIYAGSFDPPTNGHVWMIEEGARLFQTLTVAIGTNPEKDTTFSTEERIHMLKSITAGISATNVSVEVFDNRYLVDYARSVGANYILRGIRSPADFEYERVMRHINADICPQITTVFLMPPRELVFALARKGIGFETMDTPAACRTECGSIGTATGSCSAATRW